MVVGLLTMVVLVSGIESVDAFAATGGSQAGVTPTTIKVGVALVDYSCIKQFVDSVRVDEDKEWTAYFDDINANGGINGRTIVPVYDKYCPLGSAAPLAVCTKLTDDDKVFAIMGTFVDFSGDAQTCVAKQHNTPLVTFELTQAIIDKATPGLIVYPGTTNERTSKVLLRLMKKSGRLKGKTVAVLGGSAEAAVVNGTVVPTLKKLGVKTGTTAILSINGTSDTSAAQAQLQSFIERWKGEHVNSIFLSGDEVSSKQFVTAIRAALPKVQLAVDNQDLRTSARDLTKAGVKPNPYEGIFSTAGPTPHEYDNGPNWKYCRDIYKKQTGEFPPNADQVLPAPGGKTLDKHGAVDTACQAIAMFQAIATKAGKNLTTATWAKAVNGYGPIVDRGGGQFASLHRGKYDVADSFRLEAFDSTLPGGGDWKALTKIENIPG
ncbi:MAG: hypothetical protein JWL73_2001 [Actinomycetia bacterium]|nr:hypothetical protein [Actinomycetes bacterium]